MNTQFNVSLRRSRNLRLVQQESVTFPSVIQPHGVLLVVKEPELIILQVSENVESMLGGAPETLLNHHLSVLLEPTAIALIEDHLNNPNIQKINPLRLKIISQEDLWLIGLIHRHNSCLILELELSSRQEFHEPLNFYYLTKESAIALNQAETLEEVCQIAVQYIREITGFDRVMLYKFYEDNHGSVITEAKRDDLESYLGLHYPDIDIPEESRKLFLKNWLRFIFDVNANSIELIPRENPLTGTPTNLEFSHLRSASSCHLQYLQNMGVHSSMVISLIKDQKLWGLIACHHYASILISYNQRAACELLARSLSLELLHKEYNEDYEYRLQLKAIESRLLESMSKVENYRDGLVANQQDLLDLVGATGAAIGSSDRLTLIGETPERDDIKQLLENLDYYLGESRCFSTHCLSHIHPDAEAYKEIASGILVIAITGSKNQYLIWFRPEVIHTVNWAGKPEDSLQPSSSNQAILCPRKSFELWKETVHLQSLPWKKCEIDTALSLRQSIMTIILRKAEELAQLNTALRISESKEREKSVELEKTLKDLKQAQMQLIQSEKMSSLGQLVAGIAHEINNPVNFIYGNLAHATHYTRDLLSILSLYQNYYPVIPKELEEECENADLEFLVEDLPKLLNSMQIGADRIREIVRSLRNFSRLDESEVKAVNIHEGIDSTLLILNNRLKPKAHRPGIQILKNYGKIPPIQCYPSQLNQVFMNLIANAIDALEETNIRQNRTYQDLEANPNQIVLSTTIHPELENWVIIDVKDNGSGVPEEIRPKLFDPFFTTKAIGQGTGMGLAISYQIIVEKHQGKLSCFSELGKGTTFRIEIPVVIPLACLLVREDEALQKTSEVL